MSTEVNLIGVTVIHEEVVYTDGFFQRCALTERVVDRRGHEPLRTLSINNRSKLWGCRSAGASKPSR